MPTLKDHHFRVHYDSSDKPLIDFYIPALKVSQHYDRSAGFFSSSALAVAAEGIAHLIQNGGHMRLLVGASLSEEDVQAIREGHDLKEKVNDRLVDHFADPEDALAHQRLQALAWMIAQGTLEIRVVLPCDANGHPLSASQSFDYYHPKSAVFTDVEGNRVAFTGSVNESAQAWLHNYENFSVYRSWDFSNEYLEPIAETFERLWRGEEPGWISLDVPEAARQKLLKFRPDEPPTADPLEKPAKMDGRRLGEQPGAFQIRADLIEAVLFQFLRDAPHLTSAGELGAATAAVTPWPHQIKVARAVEDHFPERCLLCDEVGLGKTIEAGLILRQLLISGRVQRALILAPRSVLNQWQEELYEKFGLRVPLYDGSRFWDLYQKPLPIPSGGNPWDIYPVLLAGSQLAKRMDRHQQLLDSQGWDLLLVDEAHHARRKDFKQPVYRPNRLLTLLQDLDARHKFASLLLMTATPMQIHPVEVWDLLKLLGLGARWGADEHNFLGFFAELRKPYDAADWDFVFNLVGDYLATGGRLDPAFAQEAEAKLGPVQWSILEGLPYQKGSRQQVFKQLSAAARPYVIELARRHTPIQRYVFRSTRALLREYQRLGILKENVPTRRPEIVRIQMRTDEQALYQRIEEYISHFYQKYEEERRGLGFIMTVYRRRLTSSFYAVRESLERRLLYLRGEATLATALTPDDTEQEELSFDWDEEIDENDPRQVYKAEVAYLVDFIRELRGLSQADSKLERLKQDLNAIFHYRPTVLVFTQYTDTMDYLRDDLKTVYGSTVACYSGRGGEMWDGKQWTLVSKETVKADFKEGKIRILLCTDSASEGLNLQTCGVLFIYDSGYNPMRIEQKIGRIDRIGQVYPEVWIRTFFYKDTIEDIIFQRLKDRINWFEVVVGDLQPILAEVGEMTQRLSMLPAEQRAAQMEVEVKALEQRLQNRQIEAINLDGFPRIEEGLPAAQPPLNLGQLGDVLLHSPSTAKYFQPLSEIEDAYRLKFNDRDQIITFSTACFDEHPTRVQLLTYGNPLLDELMAQVTPPEISAGSGLARLSLDGLPEFYRWVVSGSDGQPKVIETLTELQSWLKGVEKLPAPLPADWIATAQTVFENEVKGIHQRQAEVIHLRQVGVYLAEKARAQRVLMQAALVELALGQKPELFSIGSYPAAFTPQAIRGLARHPYPWGTLVHLAFEEGMMPSPDDPYYLSIQTAPVESLKGRFNQLQGEATKLVKTLAGAQAALAASPS